MDRLRSGARERGGPTDLCDAFLFTADDLKPSSSAPRLAEGGETRVALSTRARTRSARNRRCAVPSQNAVLQDLVRCVLPSQVPRAVGSPVPRHLRARRSRSRATQRRSVETHPLYSGRSLAPDTARLLATDPRHLARSSAVGIGCYPQCHGGPKDLRRTRREHRKGRGRCGGSSWREPFVVAESSCGTSASRRRGPTRRAGVGGRAWCPHGPRTRCSRPLPRQEATEACIVSGYTYDTGVLIAAERNDRFVWALHRRLLERGDAPSVPSTVLAQSWRGGPQAQLSRLLAGCEVRPLTEAQARVAGSLLARTRTTDIVDASVVVVARERGDQVLTSDPDDLGPLSAAIGRPLVTVRSIGDLRS